MTNLQNIKTPWIKHTTNNTINAENVNLGMSRVEKILI